jgi:hypothetical protein
MNFMGEIHQFLWADGRVSWLPWLKDAPLEKRAMEHFFSGPVWLGRFSNRGTKEAGEAERKGCEIGKP